MKVFFTLDTLTNAGTEKSTLDIITHFSKETKVKVIYFYKVHDLKEAYERAGIPLVFVDLQGGNSFFKGIKVLKNLIREEKPDVVVSSIYKANIISRIACKLTGTKLIGTFVNDSYGAVRLEELKQKGINRKFKLVWLLDKWTAGIPKHYLSNAFSIAKSNSETLGVPLDKINVIYRGRESGKFPAWNPPPVEPAFKFIAIGRLIDRKGFAELIEAFAILKKDHPAITLDIFGEGKSRKKFQQIIDKNNLNESAVLHGAIPNAWQKLYGAHCFVFPSWYEGFSGALVEGMMTGIPIIASGIPMNLEAVTENETALIHKVQDAADLEKKMERMINSYGNMIEMGKKARSEAVVRFDIKTISKQYEDFLKRVVKEV
jgi:glycosyltransferase involved in cell wall biosynthesis